MTSRTSLLLCGISLFLVIETWFTIFHDCWLAQPASCILPQSPHHHSGRRVWM